MKRIVLVNHYGVTPDMPGPSRNYEMSKYFADNKNVKVEFWICGYNHYVGKMSSNLNGFKLQHTEKKGNHSVIKIKSTPYKKSAFLRQLNITIFDLITAFKILFSKDIESIIITVPPISIFNVLAARIRKIKIISDVQDLWPLFLEDMGMNNKLASKYMELSSNYLYKKSDGIAAVSKGMLDYISGINTKKDVEKWIAPLGVNTKDYSKKDRDFKLIEDKEWQHDFKVIYLGVFGRANDLHSVLNTIKKYKELYGTEVNNKRISFIFIGEGDQKKEIIEYARRLELNDVYFEDAVPGRLVPDYLMYADVCLTNLQKIDSFKLVRPNKLFQYMGLGKPIVSGIWGEFQSIIEENETGIYVDFTEPNQAAFEINKLINNDNLMKRMSINGQNYVSNHGDRKKIFEEFYNNIK